MRGTTSVSTPRPASNLNAFSAALRASPTGSPLTWPRRADVDVLERRRYRRIASRLSKGRVRVVAEVLTVRMPSEPAVCGPLLVVGVNDQAVGSLLPSRQA